MIKPLIAVIGRPNVGKSTFFNKVTGKRIAIVEDTPGVTRDRIYADSEWNGKVFTLIDTGGVEVSSRDDMQLHIRLQADIAVDACDAVVFLCDVRTGVTEDDLAVANLLRRSGKKIYLAVNKVDNLNYDYTLFYELGIPDLYPVSSISGDGIAELLDDVTADFPPAPDEEPKDDGIVRVAVVGRPNAGKSSLVNRLLGYERTVVSPEAGTTRDAVDTALERDGKKYVLIDTAGIRRQRSVDQGIEGYSVMRAFTAIRRADVCLMLIDSAEGVSEQDVRLLGHIHEEGKPAVVVMNKWDLVEKDGFTVNKFEDELKEKLKFMDYFKSIYLSALTGKRAEKVFSLIDYVYEKTCFRVTTGILNDILIDAVAVTEPPSYKGRRLKIYYGTQTSVKPPVFVLFVNDIRLMHFSYLRYLENRIRFALSLDGTPIRIQTKNRAD